MKNDEIIVKKLQTSPSRRNFYASIGIFEGTKLQIFFKNKKYLIIKTNTIKLALSEKAAEEIFAEKFCDLPS